MNDQLMDSFADSDHFQLSQIDEGFLALHSRLQHQRKKAPLHAIVLRGYSKFLTRFPYIFPLLIVALAVGCGIWAMKKHPLPDFKVNPTKGFETRGTYIRSRAWTLQNLYNHRNVDLFLKPNFSTTISSLGFDPALFDASMISRKKRSPVREQRAVYQSRFCTDYDIDLDQAKFVLESASPFLDLLSVEGIRGICAFHSTFVMPYLAPDDCPLKSLPLFVNMFSSKECDTISEDDINELRVRLATCAPFFYNKTLTIHTDHTEARDSGVPYECLRKNNVIPRLFHYIFPIGFMENGNVDDALTVTATYVDAYAYPNNPSHSWLDLYKQHFHDQDLLLDDIRLAAVFLPNHLDNKYSLFAEILLHDTVYFIVAAALILIIMVVYLRSIVLTCATIMNVGISFILAYTIYHALPLTNYFSFLNLTAGLVLIAVGADDVFIFHDSWQKAKSQLGQGAALDDIMIRTLQHAALSVFVTSLSTSAAFFVNIVSSITAIQCFGIFAGIAILCNFLLMMTWTPSIIVLIEKGDAFLGRKVFTCEKRCSMWDSATRLSNKVYGEWLPFLISKAWFVWISLFIALGIGGCIIVFVTPQLQLPRMKDFQLFKSTNLLERWNLQYEDRFNAIVTEDEFSWLDDIPLYFIWGFHPEDKGNHLDPDDKGHELNQDLDFDFYSKESQIWLENFCNNLTRSPLVKSSYHMTTCTMEAYEKMLRRYCLSSRWGPFIGKTPCCQSMTFPFTREQLQLCAPAAELLFDSQSRFGVTGEPIFNASNAVVGFKIYVRSNYKMSMSYNVMDAYFNEIKSYVDEHLEDAPAGMKSMFFTGRYSFESFYDLQRAISKGTYISIILSLVVAFVIMLMTSLNLLLTIYAIVTIGFAIICTVATIVLLGWDLNILESITISLAVGLSIDFTIHYGVAYRISPHHDSRSRMTDSFAWVGSAVAMAALTTFVAGAAMMPSSILPYTKLGIFLMLVMFFSWIYATFLFQSICHIIGPRGNFCQIPCRCCRNYDRNSSDLNSLNSVNSFDSYLVTF